MHPGLTKSLSIHAKRDRIHVRGDIEQDLRLLADVPWPSLPCRPTVRGIDLLNIAAGAYAVDRAVKRTPAKGNDTGIRTLHLCFAVQDSAFWQRPEITNVLEELLTFLTDENWTLTFEPAVAESVPEQVPLEFHLTNPPRRVALYSGGLDSAAGLANQLIRGEDDYLLVTVDHRRGLRRLCLDQTRKLSPLTDTLQQLHSTLTVHLKGGVAKRLRQQECSQRTRAFLFCAAAAVAAQTCRIQEIEMFENSVGAINLPLMTGMLIGGLATRGAHPTFLKLMGQLASEVADKTVRYSLPFAALTKAEMLISLKKVQGLETWAQLSRSCATSLRDRDASHCGECPGCIERRQAFAAADISELVSGKYKLDVIQDKPYSSNNADYLRCYLADAAAWLAGDEAVRHRLDLHLRITDVPSKQHDSIAERQYRHAQEVVKVLGHLTAQH